LTKSPNRMSLSPNSPASLPEKSGGQIWSTNGRRVGQHRCSPPKTRSQRSSKVVTEVVSYSRRITLLADKHPDKTAVIFIPREGEERSISWRELDAVTSRFAR